MLLDSDRATGRKLKRPTAQSADPIEPIEYDWISLKVSSILLCNWNLQRIKRYSSKICLWSLFNTIAISFEEIQKLFSIKINYSFPDITRVDPPWIS